MKAKKGDNIEKKKPTMKFKLIFYCITFSLMQLANPNFIKFFMVFVFVLPILSETFDEVFI